MITIQQFANTLLWFAWLIVEVVLLGGVIGVLLGEMMEAILEKTDKRADDGLEARLQKYCGG